MRNIPYEGPRRPREEQLRRMKAVIREELTPIQREILRAFYEQGKSVSVIAQERGVCRSTVYRTLHRAESKLRRYLRY